jgi:hypothetical protein
MPAANVAATRYSELGDITRDNVGNLQVAFTFSMGVNRGQEAAPLVVGDTLYVVSPYPNSHRSRREASRVWPAATWSIAARSTPTAS